MTSFQIGDIVRSAYFEGFGLGKIIGPDPELDGWFTVQHENKTGALHDGGGQGEAGYCWFTEPSGLELVLRPSELVPGKTLMRVKSQTRWLHFFDIGTIVTFLALNDFAVEAVDGTGLEQAVHVDDLEIIQTPPAQAMAKKVRTFDLNSQCGRILAHLLAGNTITPLQAFGVFGTFRLAARIKELRDAGHKIKTTIKRDPTGRPYAEYSLRNSGRF